MKFIDGLLIHNINVNDITDVGHACESEDINYHYKYYGKSLSHSIKKRGIQTPLVLYKYNNELRICDGWNRWILAKELGIQNIPAVIFNSKLECHPTENLKW